jgi:hypothetical protein
MKLKILLAALALLLGGIGATASAAPHPREEEMRRLHFECDRGNRNACVQFGVLIGENRERHGEWRRSHPDWWWWEHR